MCRNALQYVIRRGSPCAFPAGRLGKPSEGIFGRCQSGGDDDAFGKGLSRRPYGQAHQLIEIYTFCSFGRGGVFGGECRGHVRG